MLRLLYGMGAYDKLLGEVEELFLQQCPAPKLKPIFKRFDYENKRAFAALSLVRSQQLQPPQHETAVKFLTALELVNLGFSLHCSVGSNST
jgi:hypothetical protein